MKNIFTKKTIVLMLILLIAITLIGLFILLRKKLVVKEVETQENNLKKLRALNSDVHFEIWKEKDYRNNEVSVLVVVWSPLGSYSMQKVVMCKKGVNSKILNEIEMKILIDTFSQEISFRRLKKDIYLFCSDSITLSKKTDLKKEINVKLETYYDINNKIDNIAIVNEQTFVDLKSIYKHKLKTIIEIEEFMLDNIDRAGASEIRQELIKKYLYEYRLYSPEQFDHLSAIYLNNPSQEKNLFDLLLFLDSQISTIPIEFKYIGNSNVVDYSNTWDYLP